MPTEPSVTIIVPTLNEEKYIREAIASLVPTNGTVDYELIVLDGGSTDRTPSIVEALAAANPRIRLEANPARYQSAAVNRGAKIAKPGSSIIVVPIPTPSIRPILSFSWPESCDSATSRPSSSRCGRAARAFCSGE